MPNASLLYNKETATTQGGLTGPAEGLSWANFSQYTLLEKIIGSSNSIYYIYHRETGLIFFPNNRLGELLGYDELSLNPFSRKAMEQLIHPHDLIIQGNYAEHINSLEDESGFESEFRIRAADHTWRWFGSRETVFQRDNNGRVQSVLTILTDITLQKKTEDEIRNSRAKLYTVLESTTDAIFSIDRNFRYMNMNSVFRERFRKFYGSYPVKGASIFESIPEDTISFFKPLFEDAFRGNNKKTEYQAVKDDCISYHEISINPAMVDNRVAFLTCFSRDVTDQRMSLEDSKKQKNLLNAIIESAKHSVFAYDKDLRYVAFNSNHKKTMKAIYGVDIEIGRSIKDILSAVPEYAKNMTYLERALQGEQFTNIEKYGLRSLKRSFYEISFSPMRDESGETMGVCIFSHNISDRMEAERQHLLAEKKFGEIFENSPDAIFVEDSSGNILDINKAACQLQGLSKQQLIGINIRSLVPREYYRKVICDYKKLYFNTVNSVESSVWSAERGIIPVEILGKKVHYDDMPALLLQVRDISERKKMEAERRQIEEEKMRQKEEMLLNSLRVKEEERNRIAGEIHDDIGSGLSKISVICQVIKKSNDPEKIMAKIDKILESSKEVQENINEIIWAMNPQNDKLENLVAYINHYAAEFLETNQISFHINLPDTIPFKTVIGKVRRNIFLVIKEALNNISKHAGPCLVNIKISFSSSFVEIQIADDGVGFDPEKINRFKNGIHNMKQRVEEINGVFSIASIPSNGTTIGLRIQLPEEN